jgi:glycosyltransferase involved in cell wall biosynthesis
MKIAIIGTRGIPNHYGGFEQFAEYVSVGLVKLGHEVTVYNTHNHPYQDNNYSGVKIIHCKDWEDRIGTAGQFIYDFNCIWDSRKRNFDIILQLGYTSSSIWSKFFPKKSILTTNMDGLEWKRTKYSKKVQTFLKYAEKLAVKHSDYLISDSLGIQSYLKEKYRKDSVYIPYGANVFKTPDAFCLQKLNLESYGYNMLIARLEPENSIEMILDGIVLSKSEIPFIIIGKHETKFGEYLKSKYCNYKHIRFEGGIYDQDLLNNLRHFSNLYFHGHTVGGTNPSLLEAMASSAMLVAHDNIFNKTILGKDAKYFSSSSDVYQIIISTHKNAFPDYIDANLEKINSTYSWSTIIDQYLQHFEKILILNKNQPHNL